LHPDADRDARGFDELEGLDEFMECFEQLLLREFRRGNETGFVLEEFDEEKTRRAEDHLRRREQPDRKIPAARSQRA